MPLSSRFARTPAALLAASLLATACKDPVAEPEGSWLLQGELRPASIAFYGDPVVIELPETVAVGADATIEVRSYGGGCTGRGPTSVTVDDLVAEVRPQQQVIDPGPNGACTEELRLDRNLARVRFARAGVATVRIFGREQPGDVPLVVERTIRVH